MAVIIFGRRPYGRVHEHGGEYADTQFFHLNFVPLIPVGSRWISHVVGEERAGFPIRFHLRSVLATYLRIWGPVGAMALFMASGALPATVASIGLVALSAWSWTWRSRRGTRALQRSDFDRVALGSRCDPGWLTADMRRSLARELDAALAQRADARAPEDVARFGAADLEEAMLAYGLLRLRAADHPEAAVAADRLLSSAFDQLPRDGGPYREHLARAVPQLRESVAAAVRAHARASAHAVSGVKPRWYQRPRLQLVGLVLLTLCAAVSIRAFFAREGRPARDVGARVLAARPPVGHHVGVRCDRVDDPGWRVVKDDEPVADVTLCWIGTRVLPVVSTVDTEPPSTAVNGTLKELAAQAGPLTPWIAALRRDPDLDARSYDVYLARDGGAERRREIALAGAYVFLTALGWVFWIRAFQRRRRPA